MAFFTLKYISSYFFWVLFVEISKQFYFLIFIDSKVIIVIYLSYLELALPGYG